MRCLRGFFVALTLFGASACTTSESTALAEEGRGGGLFMSPEQEEQVGREQHPKVLAEFGGAYEDAKLQAFVERLGEQLVATTPMAGEDFTFTIVNSDIVNAFALPGGYVYVSRGLLALAESEAELAGVLGHEIGHVVAHHPAQRYDRQVVAQGGGMLAQILGGIAGGYFGGEAGAQLGAQLGGGLGQAGGQLWVQGYSRDQEFEADQLGVRALEASGYDPRAMASFLTALQTNDQLRARLEERQSETPNWLRSHPRTADRVQQAAAAAAQASPRSREVGREVFLEAIDGMIFGDDPSQGFVRGTSFQHPELGIAFDAPNGFRLKNSPRAVIGQDAEGRFMQFDSVRSRTSDPSRFIAGEWAKSQNVSNLQELTLNGAPAAVGFAQAEVGGQATSVMLAAVPRGQQMYRFVFGDRRGLSRSDVRLFETTLESFRSVRAGDARALRIEVVPVRAGDTKASLVARMQVDEAPEAWFELLNGFDRGRELEAGQSVKLVRAE